MCIYYVFRTAFWIWERKGKLEILKAVVLKWKKNVIIDSIYLFLSTYNLYYQYIFIGQVYYPYVIIDTVIICSYQ